MSEIQRKRKVKIEWSPAFAYGIGLLASDGFLNKDGRHIGMKTAERELIDNFKAAFGVQNKIGRSSRGGEVEKRYYHMSFGDVVFYQFLNSIGITNAKSKTIQKVQVPDKFFADFLRGIFDGDGTFYSFWDIRWPSSFVFQLAFASASIDFIGWLQNQSMRLFSVRGFVKKGDGVYNLTYFKNDTRKLFQAMYYKKDLLFLSRKFRKIQEALDADQELIVMRKQNSKNAGVAQW